MRLRKLVARIWQGVKRTSASSATWIKQASVRAFLLMWPVLWRLIALLHAVLPERGPLRRVFNHVVFTRPWRKWFHLAYIPKNRDTFFEYILTFFYQYPIRKGDVVVQIGASFGEETMRFARAVGKRGRVFAVEPESANLAQLRSSFLTPDYPQVTIISKGAWNETAELEFFVGGEREHRLADIPAKELTYEWWGVKDTLGKSRYLGSTAVSVDSLDNLLREFQLDKIDFILVETNGSELEVVEGMNEVFGKAIRLGVRGHVMRDGTPTYTAIEALLRTKGYETSITSEGMVLGRLRTSGFSQNRKTLDRRKAA